MDTKIEFKKATLEKVIKLIDSLNGQVDFAITKDTFVVSGLCSSNTRMVEYAKTISSEHPCDGRLDATTILSALKQAPATVTISFSREAIMIPSKKGFVMLRTSETTGRNDYPHRDTYKATAIVDLKELEEAVKVVKNIFGKDEPTVIFSMENNSIVAKNKTHKGEVEQRVDCELEGAAEVFFSVDLLLPLLAVGGDATIKAATDYPMEFQYDTEKDGELFALIAPRVRND